MMLSGEAMLHGVGETGSSTVELLFSLFGSGTALDTLAVFEIEGPLVTS
jgi:hypothetical protein